MASSVSSTGGLSSTIRGYGGLASGLDRDELIQQMTAGTRSKIAQQKQKQQKLEWTQTALREITNKIYNFSSSFTSYSSVTNLTSSKMFARTLITANGANSKAVSVTGTATSSKTMSITQITKLASNASLSTGKVSSQKLETTQMQLGPKVAGEAGELGVESDVSTIVGDSLFIKYGSTIYSVTMADKDGYDYSTPEEAVKAIKEQLKGVSVSGGKTLDEVMDVTLDEGKITFAAKEASAGNLLQIAGGTGDILKDLGILQEGQSYEDLSESATIISNSSGKLTGSYNAKLTEAQSLAKQLSGKELSFVYNGQVKWITTGDYAETDELKDVRADLQSKLDAAFGKGRITVGSGSADSAIETGQITFETTKPNNGGPDTSSTLSISSGVGLMGPNGTFGIEKGSGNRLNLSANLANSGLKNANELKKDAEDNDDYNLMINGVKIEGITKDTSMNEIINKINASEARVKVSYQSMSDRFVITSTENGASGQIYFGETPGGEVANDNIAKYLFGSEDAATGKTDFNVVKGQDAVFSVQYPDSNDEIEITRGTNTFTLDGMNITLNNTFEHKSVTMPDGNEKVEKAEAITFTAEVDADKTAEAVKNMIDSFNEILELVNKEGKTKPNRDYFPLTDEQKADMTEDQIKTWEEKAKEGLLFGDVDIRLMADSLRAVLTSMDRTALSNMGITVSTSYSDNGKLVFDEEKFKTALKEDPDAAMELFNREAEVDADGNTIPGGLLTRIKTVMDNYGSVTGATKGILVERAGSVYAPTTILKNNIQKQIDELDDYVVKLTKRLAKEQDRYISQFTTLETLMSQMNSQSSYLSSMFA